MWSHIAFTSPLSIWGAGGGGGEILNNSMLASVGNFLVHLYSAKEHDLHFPR
jgi:hypothetical protein